MADLRHVFGPELEQFERFARDYFAVLPREDVLGVRRLIEAMEYTALGGGKRIRPLLSILTGEALSLEKEKILPFALAVEMVHSYSLIHDDLPLMDNDDERRGKPTNHKVFGEAMALLAGDALLTESFLVLTENYSSDPVLASQLIGLLSRMAGLRGMVGGQAIDIHPVAGPREEWEMSYLHNLKTGALIRAAVDGAALIAEATMVERENLAQFAKSLGLAFQIADDLEDQSENRDEATSFVGALGQGRTLELLEKVTNQAHAALTAANLGQARLNQISQFNFNRALPGRS